MAAARGIASIVADDELREDYVIPSVFNRDVADAVAAAVADRGQGPGHGRGARRRDRLHARARPRSSAPSGPERRTPGMRITITGASGLIGTSSTPRSQQRGDEVTPLSLRDGATDLAPSSPAATPSSTSRARTSPSAGRDDARKRDPRVARAGHAPARRGDRAGRPAPKALISASAVGYYGPHGDERLDEDTPPGDDFLAQVCVAWEREAQQAEHGLRVVTRPHRRRARQGRRRAVEDAAAVQARRRRPGRRRRPVHAVDPRRRRRRHLPGRDRQRLAAARSTPPRRSRSRTRTFSKALGSALHRPAVAPIPGFAIRLLYGDMAEIVTEGQRVVPSARSTLGYSVPAPRSRRGAARRGRLNAPNRKTSSDIARASSHHGGEMADLPPDLDRLGRALTHATAHAVGAPRRPHRPPPAARRLPAGRAARVRGDDARATSARPTSRTSCQLAIEPARPPRRVCDIPRGQRFHYLEACNAATRSPRPPAEQAGDRDDRAQAVCLGRTALSAAPNGPICLPLRLRLGRHDQPDDDRERRQAQAGRDARACRRSPCGRTGSVAMIAETSQR